jgi:hypothetical protein
MRGKKWLILLASLALVLLASSTGVTRSSFVDLESSTGNTFQAWTSRQWTQTTEGDFNAGVLQNVQVVSPGDVKLESISLEPTTSIGSEESWYYTSWSRRAPVTINNTGSALTDYQVRVDVTYDADINPDFSDVRFVDSDDSTELSHWRESYIDSTSAIFWVKVPSIPSGSKVIYMYYGNAAASSASDGDATFEFFDDFPGTSLDTTNKWDVINPGAGTYWVSGGLLTIESDGDWFGANDDSLYVVSKSSFSFNYAAESLINQIGSDSYPRFFGLRASSATDSRMFVMIGDSNRSHITNVYRDSDGVNAGWYGENSGISNPGNNKIARFERNGDTVTSYYDDSLMNTRTVTGWDLIKVALTDTLVFGTQQASSFDWIFVRQYADPEPTASIGTEDGWSRRAPVTINNPGSALTDYQVRVDVTYDADMQLDFDDIRFRDSDGSTELAHWRESYIDSTSAVFWVKVPSIPSGNKTIYMYYGNDAADSGSDGDATFIFFDDFSGDLSKWNIHIDTDVAITASYGNPAPCLEISGGITSSPYGFAAIGSDATYTGFQDGIIEADIYPDTIALPEIIFRGDYSANTGYKGRWDCRSGSETPWMKPPYSGWGGFGTAVPRFGIAGQWQRAKLVIYGSTFKIYSNDNLKSTVTNTQYPGPGEIGLANHYGTYARFDNVRVRKYVQPAYQSSGTIASQVWDTGVDGARWDGLFWDEILPGSTDITFEVRASDTLFAKDTPDATLPWTSVGGASPVTSGLPSGRYMQWRATLTTPDTSETPVLEEVRVYHY